MSEDSGSSKSKDEVEVTKSLTEGKEESSSEEDPPMTEWSSLIIALPENNKKRLLHSEGLYSPGSGEICTKYVSMSDSDVFRHPYYNYPAVGDPGIEAAILSPEAPFVYTDDGYNLYFALCTEMNICPVRMFYTNLLNDEINLSYYGVNPQGVRAMALSLQYNKFVKRFILRENFLNDDACYHLGKMLSSNVTLKELDMEGCRIEASGVSRVCEGLIVNRTLTNLNLARNILGEDGGTQLSQYIIRGATLSHINLRNNNLGRQAAIALTEALSYRNKFTFLDLSWNNFYHVPSLTKLIEEIAKSVVLEELNLSFNALGSEVVASAMQHVLLIPTLKFLNLSNNKFKNDALRLIVEHLYKAKKLNTLDLSYNPMTTEDANFILEKMLKPRVKLQNLFLESICVDKQFVATLAKVMKMKSRKSFVITYGYVLQNWVTKGPDARKIILQRADFLGHKDKKHRVDIVLFFLKLYKENPKPIPIKNLIERVAAENVPLDEGLLSELTNVFPGPKSRKTKLVSLQLIVEYIERMWPDRKLPPTPPPELEPEPDPEPIVQKVKEKGKK